LADALEGATTLYNTYWIRFARGRRDHDLAVANSRTLFHAARRAGIERIVHVSVTHPAIDSPYPYFRGKALVERALAETGVPFAVVRPGILFGGDGVLINNIAWLLRHLPVFAIGDNGRYRIRPIHIADLADLCVSLAAERADTLVDAVGPERPTFNELVAEIRRAVNSRAAVIHVPGATIPLLSTVLGWGLRDVLLTKDEYRAMSDGLADSDGPTTGHTGLSEWIRIHAGTLGTSFANEIERHYDDPHTIGAAC
jgi:NADH dehydrogenase